MSAGVEEMPDAEFGMSMARIARKFQARSALVRIMAQQEHPGPPLHRGGDADEQYVKDVETVLAYAVDLML